MTFTPESPPPLPPRPAHVPEKLRATIGAHAAEVCGAILRTWPEAPPQIIMRAVLASEVAWYCTFPGTPPPTPYKIPLHRALGRGLRMLPRLQVVHLGDGAQVVLPQGTPVYGATLYPAGKFGSAPAGEITYLAQVGRLNGKEHDWREFWTEPKRWEALWS